VSGASEPMCPEILLQELQKSIQCLKNTSPGNNLIANAFLTRSPDCIKIELLNLFNTSFVSGVVPALWKQGVICPILKPEKDPTQVSSYRPITLLSCIGKLMERIIQRSIEHYIETKHLLPPTQTGYRRGRSAMDVLAVLTHTITGKYGGKP